MGFVFRSLLLTDKIVGGNCFGSPARINFLALNIGIQQTCREVKSGEKEDAHGAPTASRAWVASSIIATSKV